MSFCSVAFALVLTVASPGLVSQNQSLGKRIYVYMTYEEILPGGVREERKQTPGREEAQQGKEKGCWSTFPNKGRNSAKFQRPRGWLREFLECGLCLRVCSDLKQNGGDQGRRMTRPTGALVRHELQAFLALSTYG